MGERKGKKSNGKDAKKIVKNLQYDAWATSWNGRKVVIFAAKKREKCGGRKNSLVPIYYSECQSRSNTRLNAPDE